MTDNSMIASDALKFMGIIETFFITELQEQIIVRPVFMEMNRWIVTASGHIGASGKLRIVTLSHSFEILCNVEPVSLEMFSNSFMLVLQQNLPDEMTRKMLFLKKTVRGCSRRCEERFEIGTDYKKFGFSSAVQFFLYNEQKILCFLNNVSVHGAMITCANSEIKTGERIKIVFSFDNPSEKIAQAGIIVNRNSAANNYLRLSINFIEPISFLWQKRICGF